MAYNFYLNKILLPIAPSKLQTKINGKNKTMTLINGEEINIIKSAGLTEFTFDAILPNVKYPFAIYKRNKFKDADYFLNKLEQLKVQNKPFRFIVVRETQGGEELFDTNIKVSLEDYSITEDAGEGLDIKVSIKLKQYKNYGTKIIQIPMQPQTTTKTQAITVRSVVSPPVEQRPVEKPQPKTYTVVSGDCLWNICKKYLGDGSKCWEVAKLNGISNPNLIYPGQVINLG